MQNLDYGASGKLVGSNYVNGPGQGLVTLYNEIVFACACKGVCLLVQYS